MEHQQYYDTVCRWISSCTSSEQLNHIGRFVFYGDKPIELKQLLEDQISMRMNQLEQEVFAVPYGKDKVLADQDGRAKVFTTRFSALSRLNQLQRQGIEAQLLPGTHFYRIKLIACSPKTASH